MAASADPNPTREAAVIQAEARHLVRTLAPYRILHRDALKELCGAGRWHDGSYELALSTAVRAGEMERLGDGFYRYCAEA